MLGLNQHGVQMLNTFIICGVFAGLAVAVRIYCKIRYKYGVKGDDYWMMSALTFYWTGGAVSIWGEYVE
jgi:hypothetical protein